MQDSCSRADSEIPSGPAGLEALSPEGAGVRLKPFRDPKGQLAAPDAVEPEELHSEILGVDFRSPDSSAESDGEGTSRFQEPERLVSVDSDTVAGDSTPSTSRVKPTSFLELMGKPYLHVAAALPCKELFELRLVCNSALTALSGEIERRLKKLWFEVLPKATDVEETFESQESSDLTPVFLNVYDVTHYAGVQWVNALFANQFSPVKFGGIFHVGVQIGMKEWSYGYKPQGTGVFWTPPLYQAAHHFRETIHMEASKLSPKAIERLIEELEAEWTGRSYNVFQRNCCHFADALCQRLGAGSIPQWTYRLADLGSTAAEARGLPAVHLLGRPSVYSMGP